MIFLGAGASKPFGIPTLEEFSKEVIDELKTLGHIDVLQRIENSFKEFEIKLDFESLYSILEGLKNPLESVRHAGPLTAYFIGNKMSLPKADDYTKVLNDLRKTIYKKCSIDKNGFYKIEECYNNLFEVTKSNTSEEGLIGRRTQSQNIGRILVTTNYDMSLETYFMKKEQSINDGFRGHSSGVYKTYDPTGLQDPYASQDHTIMKLHGSIYQFFREGSIIKTILDPYSDAFPFKIDVQNEMMIYPTREKDILVYPYFSFFEAFKSIRWTKLLVIGYSFRDEPINTAILENMKYNDKSQLIIVNPDANKVVENLYQFVPESLKWQIPKHRLFTFSRMFGTSEVYDYLKRIERVSNDQDSTLDPNVFNRAN